MSKSKRNGYKKYSDEFKRQVVSDLNESGLSYVTIKEKYNIGCISTLKNWVSSGLSDKVIKNKPSVKPMVSKEEYKILLAENKRLKLKVAECHLLMDIDKYRQESVVELMGVKQAEAVEKLTKKKLQ